MNMSNSLDDIAEGAWTRLRNLIGALDRVDRLETGCEFAGWLQKLAADESALERLMREFVLRALRLASEPINARVLAHLKGSGATKVGELLAAFDLSRVELVERLNELSRAGLTIQSLENEQVEATPLALGLLVLLDEINTRMLARAKQDYLINPAAPLPPPPLAAQLRKIRPNRSTPLE